MHVRAYSRGQKHSAFRSARDDFVESRESALFSSSSVNSVKLIE